MKHLDDGSLQAWLDRSRSGMDEARSDEIRRHLADCDQCAQRLAALDDMTLRVQSLFPAPADSEAPEWDAVVERARARRGRVGRRPIWTSAGWAAGVAAVMGLGWLANDLYRSVDTTESVAPPVAVDSAAPTTQVADAPLPPGAPTESVAEALPEMSPPAVPVLPIPHPTAVAATTFEEAPRRPTAEAIPTEVAAPRSRATLTGLVTDEEGRPLSGTQVAIQGMNVGALTNAAGRFLLFIPDTALAPDRPEVTLEARNIGYADATRTLPVRPGESVSTSLQLAEQDIALDAIVVTGTPAESDARAPGLTTDALGASVSGALWASVTRAEAEAQVGFPLLVVDGLPIVDVAVGLVGGAPAVRIVQQIEAGARLTLIEGKSVAPSQQDLLSEAGYTPGAWARRNDLWIAGAADLPVDSLDTLLRRLR